MDFWVLQLIVDRSRSRLAAANVSKSHGLTVVRPRNFFSDFAQNFGICMPKLKMCMQFNLFYSFFLYLSHILCDFSKICLLFLAQNFKTKVWTAQKSTFRMSGSSILLCILRELAGGGSVALPFCVTDMYKVTGDTQQVNTDRSIMTCET